MTDDARLDPLVAEAHERALELRPEVSGLLSGVYELRITTTTERINAADLLSKGIIPERKKLEKERKEIRDPLTRMLKEASEPIDGMLDEVKQAEATIRRGLAVYDQEVRLAAAKQEAELRDRAAKEAARLEARAEKSEEKGNVEQAQALRTQAATPAPSITPNTPRSRGEYTTTIWKWKFKNPETKEGVGKAFIQVNEAAIEKTVKGNGKLAEQIVGGIDVWSVEEARFRT